MYQPELEMLPRADLGKLQLKRLQASLEHIRRNNQDYLDHLGVDQVSDLDDVAQLPFLTKDHLRDHYPFGLACAPQSEFMRMQMSSGTTGTPIICPHTAHDVEQWSEIMARCLTAAGVEKGDVIQITPSFGLFNGGFGFHYGASALQAMIVPIGAGRTKLQLQFLKDLGATAISAIASYPLRLIEVASQQGFDFRRDSQLRIGVFGAEIWSDELRSRIEAEMGIDSFDIIGMTESAGVGMGIDCSEHAGIHVWEDHYLIEVVDSASGAPVPDGEWGEMIVTTLTREALPLVRFRTRDITRVISREPCACGRSSLRVDRIAGRTDDMIKVKGVNFYPKQVESLLLGHPELGCDYLIEIDRVEGSDQMKLTVETDSESSEVLGKQLEEELHNMLGLHASFDLLPMGALPRPEGKAIRVRDSRSEIGS